MKRLKRIVAVALLCLISVKAQGQRVVVENDKVIIDCSLMPAGAVIAAKKARTTTATETTSPNPNDITDIASPASNEKVYKRFQVHSTYNNNDGTLKWVPAVDHCTNLTTDGGGWRLPTQRELMLIWLLHSALKALGSGVFTPFTASSYWSATESSSSGYSWYLYFGTGLANSSGKFSLNRVRCVRDI